MNKDKNINKKLKIVNKDENKKLNKDLIRFICYDFNIETIFNLCIIHSKYNFILNDNTFWGNKVFFDFTEFGHNLYNINKNLERIKNKKIKETVDPKMCWKKYYMYVYNFKKIIFTDRVKNMMYLYTNTSDLFGLQTCLNDIRCFTKNRQYTLEYIFKYCNLDVMGLVWHKSIIKDYGPMLFSSLCLNNLDNNYQKIKYILTDGKIINNKHIKSFLKTSMYNDKILKLIIKHTNFDPSFDDNYLMKSMIYENIVKVLLDDPRVDPTVADNYPIEKACRMGNTELVKLLLSDSRIDPTDNNNACYRFALKHNHQDVLDLLCNDPRIINSIDETFPGMN